VKSRNKIYYTNQIQTMKREIKEMTKAEKIAFYSKAVGYLGAAMFPPRYLRGGGQQLPLRVDLEQYFEGAENIDKAFEVLCGRLVIVDKENIIWGTPDGGKWWAAFTDPRGLASYDATGYSEQDIATMLQERAYLRIGLPIFLRYLIAFLLDRGKHRKWRNLMKRAMVRGKVPAVDVADFANLLYTMGLSSKRRIVVHEGRVGEAE
jgi:hypothetical protein